MNADEQRWLDERQQLVDRRYELAVAAADGYPPEQRVAGTPLLAAPGWAPATPIPLEAIDIELRAEAGPHGVTGDEAVLPGGYRRYSEVVGALAVPTVFENRSTYRLLEADLTEPRLAFGKGTYFDGLDTGEAAAHEYATGTSAGLRSLVGDPCDLRRRPVNLAISTLTIRREGDAASFLVHWRDPAKVGHAGGLYQVVPVGIFQASSEAASNERNDFSLWRSMIREFAEELRGEPEDYATPIDYDAWPFAARLTDALRRNQVRAFCLGLGVDPLTFATDLLTVVVIDAPLYDELFGAVVADNAEGRVLDAKPFEEATIDQLAGAEPMQAAGAALLRLAWQHRATLL